VKLTAGTPAQQRRQLITLAAVILVGVYLYFNPPWGPAPTPGVPGPAARVAGATAEVRGAASNTPAAASRGAASPQGLPEPVKLSALKAVGEETRGERDPFGFGVPPKPPPPPPAPVTIGPTPTPMPPPQPAGQPPRPQIPVKFLGVAEDPSRPGKLVSLSINGAVVLARDSRGRILLVRQFRAPARQFVWELPAGKIDEGETAMQAARRELKEETGFTAGRWSKLVGFWASPGFLGEKMTIYLAEALRPGPAQPMDDERIERRWFTLKELEAGITGGRIVDGKTMIGLYAWKLRRRPAK